MEENEQKPYKKYFVAVWRGLMRDATAKHYKQMGQAIWLFLNLLMAADKQGYIKAISYKRLNINSGIPVVNLKRYMATLRRHKYVSTRSTGRYLTIQISNWKTIREKKEEMLNISLKFPERNNRSIGIDTSGKSKKIRVIGKATVIKTR